MVYITNNYLPKSVQRRFLVGADTFKPSRWADLPEIADDIRRWFTQLPEPIAEDLARNNFERLFPRINNTGK